MKNALVSLLIFTTAASLLISGSSCKKTITNTVVDTFRHAWQEMPYFCASFFDKFFVYFNAQFYRIDTAGNIRAFGYDPAPFPGGAQINNMFTYGNTLYAKGGNAVFYSTDQGETWTTVDVSNTSVPLVLFRNIGKDLYATVTTLDMQLWKVVINQNKFTFSELNNDGLQGTLVTSMTRCGKYVFATTYTWVEDIGETLEFRKGDTVYYTYQGSTTWSNYTIQGHDLILIGSAANDTLSIRSLSTQQLQLQVVFPSGETSYWANFTRLQ